MAKAGRATSQKSGLAAKLEQQAARGRAEFGVSSALPALSVCRIEAPEDVLRKLRQHVDDPALAEYTCPICWDPFWQPVRTVCGHAFCESCLLKAVLAQLSHQQPDVSCPLCRHPLHVDDVTVDQALLTRIRLILTERGKETASPARRGSGRVHRGPVAAATTHGWSSLTTPSASSSASASGGATANTNAGIAGACTARPRTSQGTSAGAALTDLEGLAVTAVPTGSGSSNPAHARHLSRFAGVTGVQRGNPMRPPRTAPSMSNGADEGLTGVFPNGWFRVSTSIPRGATSATGRPDTSPAIAVSTRDTMSCSAVSRPPTAPEGVAGRRSSTRGRQAALHAAAHGPPPGTPSRRMQPPAGRSSPLGFDPLPGVTGSESAPTPFAAFAQRRCGWGPAPGTPGGPPRSSRGVRRRSAGTSGPATSVVRPSSDARAAGPVVAAGCSDDDHDVPFASSEMAADNSQWRTIPMDMAMAPDICSFEGETLILSSPEPHGCIAQGPFAQADIWHGFAPMPHRAATPSAITSGDRGAAAPAVSAWSPPSRPPSSQAAPLPLVLRPPPADGNSPTSTTSARNTAPSSSHVLVSAGPTGAATPPSGTRALSAIAASCSTNASEANCGIAGSVATAGRSNRRCFASATATLSSAVSKASGELTPRAGSSQHASHLPAQACEPGSTAYAADFAFADRYRQLLEEGA